VEWDWKNGIIENALFYNIAERGLVSVSIK